jgi:hypothetical protein
MIAVLPKGEGHSMYVMKAEVPGPKAGKVVSKFRTAPEFCTSSIFFLLYLRRSFCSCLPKCFYDAVTTALSLQVRALFVLNNSILGYNSVKN